jgi:hypothetical protein
MGINTTARSLEKLLQKFKGHCKLVDLLTVTLRYASLQVALFAEDGGFLLDYF